MKRAGLPAFVLMIGITLMLIGLALTGFDFAGRNDPPVEMVAFGGLSKAERELIPAGPKDSTVEKITVSDEIRRYMDLGFGEDQVYAVVFHHAEDGSGGTLTVFVSPDGKTVVGKGFIDR